MRLRHKHYLPKLSTIRRGSKRTLVLRGAILDLMSLAHTHKRVTVQEMKVLDAINHVYGLIGRINEKVDNA